MALLFPLFSLHRNKENEPPSLLHRNRKSRVIDNPYVTRKKVSTAHPSNQNSNLKPPPTKPPPMSTTTIGGSKSSRSSLATIEEEDETSPIIRRILEQTGCSRRQELLAKRAAQEKEAIVAATNGSKSLTNQSKAPFRNGSKAAPNGTSQQWSQA